MDNKNNHPMSVYCWTFTRRYALRHPIRIIRWYFDARRQMKQRARYGWCDNDVTDWYNWSAYVLAGLLREISRNKVITPKRAGQIAGIADRITDAVLGEVEYEDRRQMVADAFKRLGEIFFDFLS
ncbi:MAG: hypothetical protein IKI84_03070 [Clostridia bacterium]|nr:hypothetical protein [Clostridia bacterium]